MEMTKQEIEMELEKSLAKIDGSFDEIKNEITKPFDDAIKLVGENPLMAIGSAVLVGIVASALLGRNSSLDTMNTLDRKSAEILIEAGIANKESGMSLSESIDAAIRETPIKTLEFRNNGDGPSSRLLSSFLGSSVAKQIGQALFKNGLNLINSLVQDRVKRS